MNKDVNRMNFEQYESLDVHGQIITKTLYLRIYYFYSYVTY